MFDSDGTLGESTDFDNAYYKYAVDEVLKIDSSNAWSPYVNVMDTSLLQKILDTHNIQTDLTELVLAVKKLFFTANRKYLEANDLNQVAGSGEFVDRLRLLATPNLPLPPSG